MCSLKNIVFFDAETKSELNFFKFFFSVPSFLVGELQFSY